MSKKRHRLTAATPNERPWEASSDTWGSKEFEKLDHLQGIVEPFLEEIKASLPPEIASRMVDVTQLRETILDAIQDELNMTDQERYEFYPFSTG